MPSKEQESSSILSLRLPDELIQRLDRYLDWWETLDGSKASRLSGCQVAVQMTLILSLHCRPLNHLPHLTLTLLLAHQHAAQLADVQTIALGSTPASDCPPERRNPPQGWSSLGLAKSEAARSLLDRFITTDHGAVSGRPTRRLAWAISSSTRS